MRADEMILVSVDDHVVEPPDMFDQHLPPQYKAKAPKVPPVSAYEPPMSVEVIKPKRKPRPEPGEEE